MNDLSFDIKSTKDFYKKLLGDYEDFCQNKTSSRIALNCAMTAWHLSDWIFYEYNFRSEHGSSKSFQDHLSKICPSLQIMGDLANGSKHYKLEWRNPILKESKLHRGSFSSGFSRGFDISALILTLKDETELYFEDELKKVISFWSEYLKTLH